MRVKVLGSAAGGGFPQWNCGCANCSRFRSGKLKGRARTQTQVAISSSESGWFLLNASPDLRQQLLQDPEFAPSGSVRSTPIAGIILTSADVDCVMGLLHLREFQPFRIFATQSVMRALNEENSIFRALERSNPPVGWLPLQLGESFAISERAGVFDKVISCRAIPLGGHFPDYVSAGLRTHLCKKEAVVALEFFKGDKRLFYAPSLPECSSDLKLRITQSDAALLDGTFWSDSELAEMTGNARTARQMGHLPLSSEGGLIAQFKDEPFKHGNRVRRILVHLNNTNPLLDEESGASKTVREAGWEIGYDGMEFEL